MAAKPRVRARGLVSRAVTRFAHSTQPTFFDNRGALQRHVSGVSNGKLQTERDPPARDRARSRSEGGRGQTMTTTASNYTVNLKGAANFRNCACLMVMTADWLNFAWLSAAVEPASGHLFCAARLPIVRSSVSGEVELPLGVKAARNHSEHDNRSRDDRFVPFGGFGFVVAC